MILHPGAPPAPHDLLTAWSFDPGVVLPLAATGWLYLRGTRALWQSAAQGRGVRAREVTAFGLGWLTLVVALVSPVHRWGEALFSAHMVQHELLMALAAPLLVLGRPLIPWVWALPGAWRRPVGRLAAAAPFQAGWDGLTHPGVAWTVHGVAIWGWHLPVLFQATLRSETVHAVQHASFLGTGLLFWWTVLQRRQGRLGWPGGVIALFTTAVHTSLLGALLTFSSRLWYPIYAPATAAWGLTPLEDQQLAGLVMWIPGGLAYLIAALALLASWLDQPWRARPRVPLHVLPALLLVVLMAACSDEAGGALSSRQAAQLVGGDADRGRLALRQYGCAACHTIPGVVGADGLVGPPLAGVGGRAYIAGVLTNTPDHLIRWIVDPVGVDPLTAMPMTGVSEREARDIATFLYTVP
jgi:putative membrane protein